ncbi:MAG: FecR family protein [bacterium]|nr:FecR family protein [bacterium]
MKQPKLLLILLTFCLALPIPGWVPDLAAAEVVARMTLVEGTIKVRRGGKDLIYRRKGEKIELSNGDSIQTGANTKAQVVLLAKEDTIDLASNSFLNVNNVSGDTRELGMPIGKAQFKVKPLTSPLAPGAVRPFRIRTVNALVGVKGTEFVLGTGAEQTSLLTLEGNVTIANIKTPDVEVEVKQNQVAQITKAAPPTQPVAVSPQQAQNIVTADSPKAFSTVQFGEPVSSTKDSKKKEEKKDEKKEEKKDEKKEEKKEEKKDEKKEDAKKGGPAAKDEKADKDPKAGDKAGKDEGPKSAAKAGGTGGEGGPSGPGAGGPAAPGAAGGPGEGAGPGGLAGPEGAGPGGEGAAVLAGGPDGAPGPEGLSGPDGAGPALDAPGGLDTPGAEVATLNFESGDDFGDFGAEFEEDGLGDLPLLEDDFFVEVPTDELVQTIIDQVTEQVNTATETVIDQIQTTAAQPAPVTIQINH